jgi:hypothetical protein
MYIQYSHQIFTSPNPKKNRQIHQAEPLNGAIGFFPGSHLLRGALGASHPTPATEVVGATAPGSVLLYDSFTEHRGLENESLVTKTRTG